jgi:hypothetical protein
LLGAGDGNRLRVASLDEGVCGCRLTWEVPDLGRSATGTAVPRESPEDPAGPGTQRARLPSDPRFTSSIAASADLLDGLLAAGAWSSRNVYVLNGPQLFHPGAGQRQQVQLDPVLPLGRLHQPADRPEQLGDHVGSGERLPHSHHWGTQLTQINN